MISMLLLVAAATGVDCSAAQSNVEMKACAARDLSAADAALNRQYAATMRAMTALDRDWPRDSADKRAGYVATLRSAQRAWIAFRDLHCSAVGYQMRGGTGEGLLVTTCRADLTRDRTKQLAQLSETN
jgi:uncharacterized protein YecT (DUF1311 family)